MARIKRFVFVTVCIAIAMFTNIVMEIKDFFKLKETTNER